MYYFTKIVKQLEYSNWYQKQKNIYTYSEEGQTQLTTITFWNNKKRRLNEWKKGTVTQQLITCLKLSQSPTWVKSPFIPTESNWIKTKTKNHYFRRVWLHTHWLALLFILYVCVSEFKSAEPSTTMVSGSGLGDRWFDELSHFKGSDPYTHPLSFKALAGLEFTM